MTLPHWQYENEKKYREPIKFEDSQLFDLVLQSVLLKDNKPIWLIHSDPDLFSTLFAGMLIINGKKHIILQSKTGKFHIRRFRFGDGSPVHEFWAPSVFSSSGEIIPLIRTFKGAKHAMRQKLKNLHQNNVNKGILVSSLRKLDWEKGPWEDSFCWIISDTCLPEFPNAKIMEIIKNSKIPILIVSTLKHYLNYKNYVDSDEWNFIIFDNNDKPKSIFDFCPIEINKVERFPQNIDMEFDKSILDLNNDVSYQLKYHLEYFSKFYKIGLLEHFGISKRVLDTTQELIDDEEAYHAISWKKNGKHILKNLYQLSEIYSSDVLHVPLGYYRVVKEFLPKESNIKYFTNYSNIEEFPNSNVFLLDFIHSKAQLRRYLEKLCIFKSDKIKVIIDNNIPFKSLIDETITELKHLMQCSLSPYLVKQIEKLPIHTTLENILLLPKDRKVRKKIKNIPVSYNVDFDKLYSSLTNNNLVNTNDLSEVSNQSIGSHPIQEYLIQVQDQFNSDSFAIYLKSTSYVNIWEKGNIVTKQFREVITSENPLLTSFDNSISKSFVENIFEKMDDSNESSGVLGLIAVWREKMEDFTNETESIKDLAIYIKKNTKVSVSVSTIINWLNGSTLAPKDKKHFLLLAEIIEKALDDEFEDLEKMWIAIKKLRTIHRQTGKLARDLIGDYIINGVLHQLKSNSSDLEEYIVEICAEMRLFTISRSKNLKGLQPHQINFVHGQLIINE